MCLLEELLGSSKASTTTAVLRVLSRAVEFLYRTSEPISLSRTSIGQIRRVFLMVLDHAIQSRCCASVFGAFCLAQLSQQIDLVIMATGEILCSVDIEKLRGRASTTRAFVLMTVELMCGVFGSNCGGAYTMQGDVAENYKGMMVSLSKLIRFAESNNFTSLMFSCTLLCMGLFCSFGNHSCQEEVEMVLFMHEYLGSSGLCGLQKQLSINPDKYGDIFRSTVMK